jgi:regulator of RNase E activity RraB
MHHRPLFGLSLGAHQVTRYECIGRYKSLGGALESVEQSHGFVLESNRQKQLAMTPKTVEQLRTHGVTSETNLKLEFFFYTDTADKADALKKALSELKYEVEQGLAAADKTLRVITGWSTAMQMKDEIVVAWTEQMCRIGFSHDCDFDGWGTNPEQ